MHAAHKTLLSVWLWGGLFLLVSCKKDEDNASPALTGNWIGQYGFGSNATGEGYKFFIQDNGLFGVSRDTTSTTPSATGTWHLSGNHFRATYIYLFGLTYTAEGTMSNNKITGTWGEEGQNTLGQFAVTKK